MLTRARVKHCNNHYQIRCWHCGKLIQGCGCMIGSDMNLGLATCASCIRQQADEDQSRLLKIKTALETTEKPDHETPYQSPWPICG